jgi:ABC-type Fe3+-hydroxamate transport system substrate-binding protein
MTMRFEPKRNTTTMLAALLGVALVLSGCGSSSSPKKPAVQAAHPTASLSNPDIGAAQAQVTAGAASAAPSTSKAVSPASKAQNAGTINDAHGSSGPKPLNPCALVSLSQADAITGGAVLGRIEAPLGPTCIYRLGNAQTDVTLAIESMSFSQVAHQMRKRSSVLVGGRRGYCGTLGTQMLFLPLSRGRILNVTAPCAQAQRFAAAALIHIAA